MKKVLYVGLSCFSQTGGIEKVNRAWLKVLDNLHIDNKIKVKANVLLDKSANEKYIATNRFEGFKGKKLLFTIKSISQALKKDILVLSHINLAVISVIAKWLKPSLKVIIHAHGIEVWRPLSSIQKKTLADANVILAVSRFTKQQLIEKHKVESRKIIVFPNCLDPFFPKVELNSKPQYLKERYQLRDQPVLFTLARLSSSEQYKGYDKVIEILPALLEKHPDLHYLIGGKADEAEKERIEKLIKETGVQKHVTLTGFVTDEELSDHYQLADAFVMPSEGEGFGISFIEAGACGTPSLAGNRDGSADAVIENQTGMLCDNRDPKSIEEITSKLLSRQLNPVDIQAAIFEKYGFEQYREKISDLLVA
ncbi:glycosyltransferase [Pedobacter sp. HMF7647]|uniref:Glycosyltransferase n=1 Tax=Hufsiella arboris TaxID=2695275 RepID=A0A7K1YE20_9SPHI|nr:glycosyltransferase family 4 protein [Hufsiella arboris]MXV52835.1 glycosyltransferase [Hufsiella arboris]